MKKNNSTQERIEFYRKLSSTYRGNRNSDRNLKALAGVSLLGLLPCVSFGQGGCGSANNVSGSTMNGNHGEGFANVDGGAAELHFYGTGTSAFLTRSGTVQVATAGLEGGNYPAVRRFTGGEVLPGTFNFANPNGTGFWQIGENNWDDVDDALAFNYGESGYIAIKKGNSYGFVRITMCNPISPTCVISSIDINLSGIANHTGNVGVGNCASLSTPLPIELLAFEAQNKRESIALHWQTATETNNAGFEVQRSTDGNNFRTLDFIEGKGTTIEQQRYYYDDKDLRKSQLYYYRLRQIDFDGQFEYSKIITAKIENNQISGTFSPNPIVNSQARLDYITSSEGQLLLRVFDITGKELLKQTFSVSKGDNQLDLDFNILSSGIYLVKMEQKGYSFYEKIVLE